MIEEIEDYLQEIYDYITIEIDKGIYSTYLYV